MLVLSRKAGQELVIDGQIRITINRISGNRVTLGITAPDKVRIMRGELDPPVDAGGSQAPPEITQPPAAHASLGWVGDTPAALPDLSRQSH